jgi:hypothetical protein
VMCATVLSCTPSCSLCCCPKQVPLHHGHLLLCSNTRHSAAMQTTFCTSTTQHNSLRHFSALPCRHRHDLTITCAAAKCLGHIYTHLLLCSEMRRSAVMWPMFSTFAMRLRPSHSSSSEAWPCSSSSSSSTCLMLTAHRHQRAVWLRTSPGKAGCRALQYSLQHSADTTKALRQPPAAFMYEYTCSILRPCKACCARARRFLHPTKSILQHVQHVQPHALPLAPLWCGSCCSPAPTLSAG